MGAFGTVMVARQGRSDISRPLDASDRRALHGAAAAMVGAFVLLRSWTLFPSWFYADDHRLLSQARESGLTAHYLVTPFDSQYMPLGRFLAWVVAQPTTPSWTLACVITLVLLACTAAACWWMLVTVFGERWEVLALLALFLSSTLALPAAMWWAASLNQLPFLVAWCGSVAAGVRYLRTGRRRWLVSLLAMVALGLLAYVKTLLVVPVLAFLAFGYFSSGSLTNRLAQVCRRRPWGVAGLLALTGGFTAYYVLSVPQPFVGGSAASVAGPVADRLIGTSWASAVLGGPWRWDGGNAPVGVTDPWPWLVHLAWVLVAGVVAYAWLRRQRSLRAWALLALCLGLDYGLLMATRAPFFGAISGNEMRYLTEAAAAVALCVGLALLPVRDAAECSRPRPEPRLRPGLSPVTAGAATVVVVLSSAVSTVSYARIWHQDNPGERYVANLAQDVRVHGRVDLVDAQVPDEVMPPLTLPYNRLSTLTRLHVQGVSYPSVTGRLMTVTADGHLTPAVLEAGLVADSGPTKGCGYKVTGSGRTIDLPAETIDVTWWVRIAYLSSQSSPVRVTAGSQTGTGQLQAGLGTLFVRATGQFDSIGIAGLSAGTTLCVDAVEVGTPVVEKSPS